MKLCHFEYKNVKHWGAVNNDSVFPLDDLEDVNLPSGAVKLTKYIKIENVKFLPPASPSKIVCVGRNYAEHAAELGNKVPKEPLLFLKAPSAIITEGEAIFIPKLSNQIEHEGELAVVIRRSCKNLSENDNPLEYVFGYTCLNDITARDLQRQDVQFTRAKSFDTFCPIGAFIETELDVADIRVITKVNGVIKQTGRTSQMVFPVPFLIRYISNQMTLNAGDIIATGTPSGVSKLNDGDIVEVEIEGIGTLRNPIKKLN
ncbi:MAG: fumarylacetoacetate hydrolase family protein [Acidobacteria bacterium]|jgi:2-keto-4-pentenoate hydratase/2-oxohepta-3-ene-1,7-dioic acid hydratase in catechol pathway|nr:fumarylacetoacetate hydrolase family protein [Acidobacteriota bacterium]